VRRVWVLRQPAVQDHSRCETGLALDLGKLLEPIVGRDIRRWDIAAACGRH
jgi:hypothetical protein